MKLKSDINLLKAAGGKQSLDKSASMTTIAVVVLILVVGVLGYMIIDTKAELKGIESAILEAQAIIDNPTYQSNLEIFDAKSEEIASLNGALSVSTVIEEYKNSVDYLFPHLSVAHEKDVTNRISASLCTLNSTTYKGSKVEFVISTEDPANIQVCMDTVLGGDIDNATGEKISMDYFTDVGYKCPFCDHVSVGDTSCDNPDCPGELPDGAVDTGTITVFTLQCTLKTVVELTTTTLLPTTTLKIVEVPSYSSSSISIKRVECARREPLDEYLKSLKQSGYFKTVSDTTPFIDENGKYYMENIVVSYGNK